MKTMTVGNLKAHFSSVLKDLRKGEEIVIEYGKNHEKLGVIIPYSRYKPPRRNIGLVKNASFTMEDDYMMTEEELLSL